MNYDSETEWIRLPMAAKVYGCHKSRIYQLVKAGKLQTRKYYGVKLVNREAVLALREDNAQMRQRCAHTSK